MQNKKLLCGYDIEQIAALAKLSFDENELGRMTADINEIIAFAAKLAPSDCSAQGTACSVCESELREDKVLPSTEREALFGSELKDGFVLVPRVIEEVPNE